MRGCTHIPNKCIVSCSGCVSGKRHGRIRVQYFWTTMFMKKTSASPPTGRFSWKSSPVILFSQFALFASPHRVTQLSSHIFFTTGSQSATGFAPIQDLNRRWPKLKFSVTWMHPVPSNSIGTARSIPLFLLYTENISISGQTIDMRKQFRIPTLNVKQLRTEHRLFEPTHFSSEQKYGNSCLMLRSYLLDGFDSACFWLCWVMKSQCG